MKTIWNETDRRELRARLERLTPVDAAKWGRMSAPQMVVHLCDAFRMATGELACESKKLPVRYFPLKQLFIYWLPFPKGAPTSRELLTRPPGDWKADMADLHAVMDRVARGGPAACTVEHPAFGQVSGKGWGVLAYKHTDHHLRQFGR